jgi:MFS transporter, CP family, cyanate transporter
MTDTKALSKDEIRAQKELEFKSPYRWVALICIGLMHAVLMGVINQPAAFAEEIMGGMGASTAMFAQICTVGFLTGAIFSIPMGVLADKWSVKGTMGLGLIVTLIGSIWRIFCASSITLYIACFIMGMGLAGMNANSPKFLKAWFGFRRVTTAMGIYVGCAGIGVSGCMAVIGLLGSMYNTYVFNAILVLIATVVWFIFGKVPTAVATGKEEFSVAAVKSCLTNKYLMITALAMVLFMSVQVTYQSQAAAAFQYIGVDAVTAAAWSSIASLIGIPANFLWTWLADKVGRIKAVLVPIVIIGLIAFTTAWILHAGVIVIVLICIGYFFAFVGCGFIKGCVGKIPTIKREYMGTAGGIQTFFQNLGAYIIPSFILAPLCGGDYILMFYMVSGLLLLALLVTAFLLPELGAKGKLAQEHADELNA